MAQESVRMDSQPGDTAKHLSVIGCKAVLDSRKVKEWGLNPKVLPFDVQLINQPVLSISSIRIRFGPLVRCL